MFFWTNMVAIKQSLPHLTSIEVTTILSLHQLFFWPSLVAIHVEHCLTFFTQRSQVTKSMCHTQNSTCDTKYHQSRAMVSEICSRQKIFKFCKLGTQLAYATLKIQHTQTFLVLAPPTYQVSSRQSIMVPEKCSGQNYGWRMAHRHLYCYVSSWTKFRRAKTTVGTLKQTISWWYNSSDGRKSWNLNQLQLIYT